MEYATLRSMCDMVFRSLYDLRDIQCKNKNKMSYEDEIKLHECVTRIESIHMVMESQRTYIEQEKAREVSLFSPLE